MEISDIQRGQAGEYECVTHNGVNSAPDSRRVLVTVNCELPPALGTEEGWALGPWGGGVCVGGGTWRSSWARGRRRLEPTRGLTLAGPTPSPDPPTITDVTSARTALGRAALLRCEAMAVPPADFQWYKDDRL